MPQEDDGTSKLHHPEEILWIVFPANDDASKVMKPSEQALDLPATPVTTQHTAVLRGLPAARRVVRCNQLDAEVLTNSRVQRIAVVSAVADQSLGNFGEEPLLDRSFDEFRFMRRSAGHVH